MTLSWWSRGPGFESQQGKKTFSNTLAKGKEVGFEPIANCQAAEKNSRLAWDSNGRTHPFWERFDTSKSSLLATTSG